MLGQSVGLHYSSPTSDMSNFWDEMRTNCGGCVGRGMRGDALGEQAILVRACGLPLLKLHAHTDGFVGRPALWQPQRSRGGASRTPRPTMRTSRNASLTWQRVEDVLLHHVCDMAACPHTVVNAQVARCTSGRICSRTGISPEAVGRAAQWSLGVCQPVWGWGNEQTALSTTAARRDRLALPCGHAGRVTLPALVAGRLPQRCSLSNIGNRNALNELNDVKYVSVLNKITADIAFERILCYNHATKENKHAA